MCLKSELIASITIGLITLSSMSANKAHTSPLLDRYHIHSCFGLSVFLLGKRAFRSDGQKRLKGLAILS